jgi:hypothetical protein
MKIIFDQAFIVDGQVIFLTLFFVNKKHIYYLYSKSLKQIKRLGPPGSKKAPRNDYYVAAKNIFFNDALQNYQFNGQVLNVKKCHINGVPLKIGGNIALRNRIDLLKTGGIRYLKHGYIQITKKRDNGSRHNTPRIRGIVAGLNQQISIISKYLGRNYRLRGEINQLYKLLRLAIEANNLIKTYNQDIYSLKRVDQIITFLLRQLFDCRDEYKKEISAILAETDVFDKAYSGCNSGLITIALNQVIKNLFQRTDEINKIIPIVLFRKSLFESEKKYFEANIKNATKHIDILLKKNNEAIKKYPRINLDLFIKIRLDLEQLWPIPYYLLANEALMHLARAEKMMRLSNFQQMQLNLAETKRWINEYRN